MSVYILLFLHLTHSLILASGFHTRLEFGKSYQTVFIWRDIKLYGHSCKWQTRRPISIKQASTMLNAPGLFKEGWKLRCYYPPPLLPSCILLFRERAWDRRGTTRAERRRAAGRSCMLANKLFQFDIKTPNASSCFLSVCRQRLCISSLFVSFPPAWNDYTNALIYFCFHWLTPLIIYYITLTTSLLEIHISDRG